MSAANSTNTRLFVVGAFLRLLPFSTPDDVCFRMGFAHAEAVVMVGESAVEDFVSGEEAGAAAGFRILEWLIGQNRAPREEPLRPPRVDRAQAA